MQQQLAHIGSDDTFEQHIEIMRPRWMRHVDAGHVKILHSNPDGACMFNSVSLMLTGHEGYNEVLRLHTLAELLLHINTYTAADGHLLVEFRCLNRRNMATQLISKLRTMSKPRGYVPGC
jgi:hypothetical protein